MENSINQDFIEQTDQEIQLQIYYDMYEDGHFCDCKEYGVWDRVYSDNDKFVGYKLQHIRQCIGRVKLSELIKEVKNGQS